MRTKKQPELREFRATMYAPPEKVDAEKGMIYGVAVVTKGEAKSHFMRVDDTMLSQVVELGNKGGVKARFGHPGLEDAIGTYCGEFNNFKIVGDTVRADFSVDELADMSPKYPGMGKYLLKFAATKPDYFGTSIVFFGRPDMKDGVLLARVKELRACDFVDEPAANPSGLFSVKALSARKEFSMAEVTCPECGHKWEMSADDEDDKKKPTEQSRKGAIALGHDCVSKWITGLSLDQARKLIEGRADLVEAIRKEGRDTERKYRQEFTATLTAAGLTGEEALKFSQKYDGRSLEDVKEFATLTASKRAAPVGEGGVAPVPIPEAGGQVKPDVAADARKRFSEDATLRKTRGVLSVDPKSDEWKKAEDKYVAAVVAMSQQPKIEDAPAK